MYKRIPVKKLTGPEKFKNIGNKKISVLDFWRYGFSNLNSNILRGVLAEFVVEIALKESNQINVRNPWDDFDVLASNGKKIEVKCCSYIQDWDQNQFSRILWSGLKAKELYYSDAVKKQSELKLTDYKADIYILSLLKHQDHATLDILNMNQWAFYILSKEKIKEISNDKSSVSLIRLKKFNIEPVGFNEISKIVTDLST